MSSVFARALALTREQTKHATAQNIASHRDTSCGYEGRRFTLSVDLLKIQKGFSWKKPFYQLWSREKQHGTQNNRGEYKLHEHFFCVDASEISSNVSLVPRGAWGVGKKVRVEWWKVDKERAHFPRPIVPRFITFSFLQILLFHFVETQVERKNSIELLIFTMLREPVRLAPNGTVH